MSELNPNDADATQDTGGLHRVGRAIERDESEALDRHISAVRRGPLKLDLLDDRQRGIRLRHLCEHGLNTRAHVDLKLGLLRLGLREHQHGVNNEPLTDCVGSANTFDHEALVLRAGTSDQERHLAPVPRCPVIRVDNGTIANLFAQRCFAAARETRNRKTRVLREQL